jgi:hypothetical protein
MELSYRDPKQPASFGGVNALQRALKGKKKNIQQWLSLKDSYTLHKPIRHKFQRNRVLVSDIDRQFQTDLADMQSLSQFNKGYKYLLTCIDVFSKYAWAIPLKDKTGKSVKVALETIFKERKPQVLQSDDGTEYKNKIVQDYLKSLNIKFFTTHNQTKSSVIERFNRTLKTKMWKYFTEFNTRKYIDVIDQLLYSYNHTYHRSIKMEPSSVNQSNKNEVLQNQYGDLKKLKPKSAQFKVDDTVRISKQKLHFEKGYEQNWTRELFKIHQIIPRIPVVYKVKDLQGEVIEGTFYEAELQKVIDSGFYPVEKVIKKRKRNGIIEYFVKFQGYPEKFNTWVTDVKML